MRIKFTLDVKIMREELQTIYNANIKYCTIVSVLYGIIIIIIIIIIILNILYR